MANNQKIKAVHGQLNLTAEIHKEDPLYVAKCKELKVVSQGETAAKALTNLEEAIELYLEDEDLETVILPLKFNFDLERAGASR